MTRTLPPLIAIALLALGAGLVAGTGAPAVAFDDGVSKATVNGSPIVSPLAYDPPTDVVTSGANNHPTWHVFLEDNESSTLSDWAAADDQRSVERWHNDSEYALLEAPPAAIGVTRYDRWRGDGLAAASWVDGVAINRHTSVAESVDPIQTESGVTTPDALTNLQVSLRTPGGGASYSRSAFATRSETNVSTLAETRNITHADQVSANGSGTTIAILSTGVNTANGQLFGNGTDGSTVRLAAASKSYLDGDTVSADGNDAVEDQHGRGTALASVAAGNSSDSDYDGYAGNATILALQTHTQDGTARADHVASGLRYAADNGADIILVDMSDATYHAGVVDAADYALSDDNTTAIVAPAGNQRSASRWLSTPADAPVDGVLAVGATNTSQHEAAQAAYFSQVGGDPGQDLSNGATTGAQVTTTAPGMRIEYELADRDGTTETAVSNGTGVAAAQVAGGMAQVLDANPDWTGEPAVMAERVRNSSRPIPTAAVAEVGSGQLAVDYLNDSWSPSSQSASMSVEAERRQVYWDALSRVETSLWRSFSGVFA